MGAPPSGAPADSSMSVGWTCATLLFLSLGWGTTSRAVRLHCSPLHPLPNPRKHLPRNRACRIGVIVGRDPLLIGCPLSLAFGDRGKLTAENHHLVARLHAVNLRHIDYRLVHAYAAHNRRSLTANQQAEP